MLIEPIPCLTDNYAYIVYDDISKITSVIDPSEAKPIISFLKEKKQFNLSIKAVKDLLAKSKEIDPKLGN